MLMFGCARSNPLMMFCKSLRWSGAAENVKYVRLTLAAFAPDVGVDVQANPARAATPAIATATAMNLRTDDRMTSETPLSSLTVSAPTTDCAESTMPLSD